MMKTSLAAAALVALVGARPTWAQTAPQQSSDMTMSAANADAGASAADDQAAVELREHHRHHPAGGITKFVAMSIDTLDVDDSKRPQLDKLQHDLYACLAPAGKVEKKILRSIADGVAAGSIDATRVDANIDQLGMTSDKAHSCSAKTLNRLHDLLSPEERQELVDKVEAHWQVWRQVNYESQAGGQEKGGQLAELTQELSLTSDQREKMSSQLHAALPPAAAKFDPSKGEAHMQAFAAAFTADSFNAQSIMTNANGYLATNGARRMALFYETVTPLLTPEQCTTLAQHLRQHSGHQPSAS